MKRLLKRFTGMNTRRTFQRFASKYDLVYFGHVDQHNDEHQLVRGLTLSAHHVDRHYSVGHVGDRDVTLLERTDTLSFPRKKSRQYKWTIMQFDLNKAVIPHVFIDANHYDETFYSNLFITHTDLKNYNHLFANNTAYNEQFTKHFKVYADQRHKSGVVLPLTPLIINTLEHHFRMFDYELIDDKLLIYSSDSVSSLHTLDYMLRVGLWLSERLEEHIK